jgi:hypothetical protein
MISSAREWDEMDRMRFHLIPFRSSSTVSRCLWAIVGPDDQRVELWTIWSGRIKLTGEEVLVKLNAAVGRPKRAKADGYREGYPKRPRNVTSYILP